MHITRYLVLLNYECSFAVCFDLDQKHFNGADTARSIVLPCNIP
jgi:hypothetical protein